MFNILATTATDNQNLFQHSAGQTTSNVTWYVVGVIIVLVMIALLILMIDAMWRIFTKLGEKGWKSIVPVYNTWTFLKLGDKPGWWTILAFIPIINIVSSIMVAIAAYNIGLKLRKPGWYVVLYLLVLPVWAIILAFDKNAVAQDGLTSGEPTTFTPATPHPFSPAAADVPVSFTPADTMSAAADTTASFAHEVPAAAPSIDPIGQVPPAAQPATTPEDQPQPPVGPNTPPSF